MSIQPIAMNKLTGVVGGINPTLCRAGLVTAGIAAGAGLGSLGAESPTPVMLTAAGGVANALIDAGKGDKETAIVNAIAGFAPFAGRVAGAVGGAYTGGRGAWHAADALCKK